MIRATGRPATIVVVVALLFAALMLPATAAPTKSTNNTSERLRSAVTLEGVRRHQLALQEIADEAGGNRFAGLPGHDNSVVYVADQLRKAGYRPTFQTFEYFAFLEETPSQLSQVSPTATTYVNGNDFRVLSYSGSGSVTGELTTPSGDMHGCRASDYGSLITGKIAIVRRGAPSDFTATCTFRLKMDNAIAAGAAALLVYNNVPGVVNGTLGEAGGLSGIPGQGLTQALGESLRTQMASGPVVMTVVTDTDARLEQTQNVFAETVGGDPTNVVMVGAHLDSVTAGPGINDNGSGSAAVLETAIQMSRVNPRNKVRFAWWSAEESGLVGANRYIASLSDDDLMDIALYLNFDMIGSQNFVRFIYDGDNSAFPAGVGGTAAGPPGSDVIESVFAGFYQSQGLASEPTPFNGRSDYGPFIAKGIPAGGLFTGAEGIKTPAQAATFGGTAGVAYDPCYHAACDTYANNSDEVLAQNSDAVAHTTISFAQNTELINGVRGRRISPSLADAAEGSTSGGGGGLHDDHDHDAEF